MLNNIVYGFRLEENLICKLIRRLTCIKIIGAGATNVRDWLMRVSRILNHRPKAGLAEKELRPVVAGKTRTRIDDRNKPLPCPYESSTSGFTVPNGCPRNESLPYPSIRNNLPSRS